MQRPGWNSNRIGRRTMIFSLEDKVAVVTGAARGNGKAIADGLREFGATVIIW